jgi:transcriptional regulator of acetoin/glycerol metabolism
MSGIQECDGAVGEAATRRGISRKTLWEKMKGYGIGRQHLERERVT